MSIRERFSAYQRKFFVLSIVLSVSACSSNENDYAPGVFYGQALSPDGEVEASVYHYDSTNGGLTQVGLDFVGRGCGAGSVSWHEFDIGLELRWIDSTTLEVKYPDGMTYRHNASGDLLGCYERTVRVITDPRSSADLGHGAYSTPIKSGYTPSPDQAATAYTFRYDSPQGGITQVVVQFPDERGCEKGAATFYAHNIDLDLQWIAATTLEVRYPDGERVDLLPWGSTVRCMTRTVDVKLEPNG